MNITANGDDGIYGSGVTNFTLNASQLQTNGNAQNDNGIDFGDSSVAPNSTVAGTVTVSNSIIQGSATNNIYLGSNGGSLMLTISNNTIQLNSMTNGNDGVLIQSYGTANITANVLNNIFMGNRGDHFQAPNGGDGD